MSTLVGQRQMGRALIWTNLLSEPLFTLYNLLAFILYKDLGASVLQIALLTMLKPIVALLSFYWSAGLARSGRVKSNVLWAGFWMRAPFLLCPWVDNSWFVIAAAVNYMFFYRAAIPGWMEMIKRHLGERKGRIFSLSSALGYAEGVALTLACGAMLDRDPGVWKFLVCGSALVGIFALWVQAQVPAAEKPKEEPISLKELIVRPWKESWELVNRRPDFLRFQWAFMISGFAIMLIQPALPLFAVDWLGVSYLEMLSAMACAKGLGFVLSSSFWARSMERLSVWHMTGLVSFAFALFPILLAASVLHIGWLYAAYFLYGVASSGSHLVWHMSGPLFAGREESAKFSSVNVVTVGLRGAFAPPLGSWIAVALGPLQVLAIGSLLAFFSAIHTWRAKDSLSIKS